MKQTQFRRLLEFLERLDAASIPYQFEHSREDALMVIAFAPGEYWEIEFIADGIIEIERYRSNGHIDDESVLAELFSLCADEDKHLPQDIATTGASGKP